MPTPEPSPEREADALAARYDDIAEGYLRWWAPVIRPQAVGILDAIAPAVEAGATRILDIGVGSGALAVAALERWPALRVTGIDPSTEMLAVAQREAVSARVAERLTLTRAGADRLPFDDGAFDVAVSSFVLQLVPNRHRALVEARRVLTPGATLAWVCWLKEQRAFRGDEIADAVLDEAGYDPPEPEGRSGDLASVPAAALATRRAGFRGVRAWAGELVHRWEPESFLAFFTRFDEASLFDELGSDESRRVEARLLERLRTLTPDELTLRLPTVSVVGRVPTTAR